MLMRQALLNYIESPRKKRLCFQWVYPVWRITHIFIPMFHVKHHNMI